MESYKAPDASSIRDLMDMFIPNGVTVTENSGANGVETSHAAMFVNGDGNVVASCSVDLVLAAALGASLSMIPPEAAQDMVKEKALTSIAVENLYEVMNMFSSLFMDDSTAHLKLTEVIATTSPPELAEPAQKTTGVDIQAGTYGKGYAEFVSI